MSEALTVIAHEFEHFDRFEMKWKRKVAFFIDPGKSLEHSSYLQERISEQGDVRGVRIVHLEEITK